MASTTVATHRPGVPFAVTAAEWAAILVYGWVLTGQSGPPMSIENIAVFVVPPLALGGLLKVGSTTAREVTAAAQRAGRLTTWVVRVLFGLTVLLLPVGILGEMMDGIG